MTALLFRNRFPLYAFGLTAFVFVLVSILNGIAPFGQNSLLTMDLWGQYYPMIVEKLNHPFSIWSWNGSLGFSELVQGAYYTNSLFNFLLLPFRGYSRLAAMDMMIFLKASLAAFSFAFYLERRRGGVISPLSMALGMAYGLSSYVIAFISQPMWLDAVLFLPLILLGLERLLDGGKPWLYVIFLFLTLYSNFYIGWMVCLFSVIWFFVTLASDGNRRTWKCLSVDAGKFAGFSLASGTLAAFTLLPVVYGMQNWISSSLGFDREILWSHPIAAITDNLSAGIRPSLEYGVANIYCGSAAVFFALLFLLNRKIPLAKRIAYFFTAGFLFISFELNLLDFIWHGLHFPNQLPGRQSFLFAFIMLLMAYETLTKTDGIKLPSLCVSALLSGSVMLIGLPESKNQTGRYISLAVIFLFFFVLAAMYFFRKTPVRELAAFAIAVGIALDAMISGVYVMTRYVGYANAVAYTNEEALVLSLTKEYESGKDDFYRSEMASPFTFDPGMLYDYKGVSYYSSTMNGRLYHTFEALGNRVYALNVSTIYQPSPILDMMFGIRHYYTRGNSLPKDYGKVIAEKGIYSVIESPYHLPIAFGTQKELLEYEASAGNPMSTQARFLMYATGYYDERYIVREAPDILNVENASPYYAGGKQYYSTSTPSVDTVFEYAFDVKSDGMYYVNFGFVAGDYTVRVNDGEPIYGACYSDSFKNVGLVKAGDRITVKVVLNGYGIALCGVTGYSMNKEAVDRAHQKLAMNGLDVTYASNTVIRGTIRPERDMLLYSSIPAEAGWSAYVDGERVETSAVMGAFLAFPISQGEHTVEYRYRAPGLALGVSISVCTAALLAGYYFFFERKKKKAEA